MIMVPDMIVNASKAVCHFYNGEFAKKASILAFKQLLLLSFFCALFFRTYARASKNVYLRLFWTLLCVHGNRVHSKMDYFV